MSENLKRRLKPLALVLIALTAVCILIQINWGDVALTTIVTVLGLMVSVASFFLSEKVLFPKPSEAVLKPEQPDEFFSGGVIDGEEQNP